MKTAREFIDTLLLAIEKFEDAENNPITLSMQAWKIDCSPAEWATLTGMQLTLSVVIHLREHLHRRHIAHLKQATTEDDQGDVETKHGTNFLMWFDALAGKHGHIITEDAIQEHRRAQPDKDSKPDDAPD